MNHSTVKPKTAMVDNIVNQYMFDRGVVHLVGGYIVYHYYLGFDRREVHVVVVILSTITI
jgi:hypothetical protein